MRKTQEARFRELQAIARCTPSVALVRVSGVAIVAACGIFRRASGGTHCGRVCHRPPHLSGVSDWTDRLILLPGGWVYPTD
jgi:hypothetical protein